MFKKFISMAVSAFLMALGLSAITAGPASAADISSFVVGCSQGPLPGQSTTGVNCANPGIDPEWTLSSPTWSPTVSSTFAANTVYSVTYTLTPAMRQSGRLTIPTLSANVFSVNTGYAGSPSGTTVTSLASTSGDSTMTITITFPSTGSIGGGGGGGGGLQACSSDLLSSSSTIKGVVITTGQSRSLARFSDFYANNSAARGSVNLSTAEATGSGTTVITTTDGSPVYWLYLSPSVNSFSASSINGTSNQANESIANPRGFVIRVVPTSCAEQYYWINITVGGSSPAPVAKAAAAAAAAIRAAEVAVAQDKLSTVLKADKAGTIDEYKSANVNITTAASLARINTEVLKLSANDRSDFAKIKAIADKIEFDESFFNATARPTLSTYAKYEVVGITERTLPTINTKVLELPAALRVDAKAIQDLVKVESFVDQVANTQTRSTVSSAALISRGLLSADSPYKHSVRSGLGSYPEGSLNTMAKIEAAIKAELVKAGARKAQTAEIRARIAARNK
jgi:hypothetical protein